MVTPSGPWKASAKHRRWILKRYGRGPRKKPPEPPPSPAKRTTGNRTAQPKLRPSTRTSRRINYQCIRQTTIHPQCIYRATAPFLAGRRRSYHHISNRYWRAAKASILHNHRHGYIRRLYNKIAQKASCIKSTSLRLIHFPFVKALLQPFIQLTAPLNNLLHSNTNPNLEAKNGPAIPTPINASPTRNTCNTGANSSQEKKDPPSLFTSLFQPKRWVQQYNTPLRCLIQHTPMANSVASEESPGGSGTVVTTPWQ
jgi:hypothetical protein